MRAFFWRRRTSGCRVCCAPMMIVSVTRDPRDMAAIRASGVRATLAASVSAGLLAASRSDARLIVCDVARLDADIRSSFRGYDDLAAQLGDPGGDERNATREILRGIAPADGSRVRDFIAVMAVLGE